MDYKYISDIQMRTARPRSKRLREQGGRVVNNGTSVAKTDSFKNFVTFTKDEEITGIKDFINGIKINGLPIIKLQDDVIYIDSNVVVHGGITMYAGDNIDTPSIYDGLPIDWNTLIRDKNGVLKVNPNIELGGASSWDELEGKPSWITDTKPKYSYSEIQNTPDLSVYATQEWVTGKNYLTAHQSIYTLTFQAGSFNAAAYTPNSSAKTVNIPTTTAHISESGNLYFTNARAINALADTLKSYVTITGEQTISGKKNFTTGGLFVNGKQIQYDATSGCWKLEGNLLVTGGVTMYADGTTSGGSSAYSTLGSLSNVDDSIDASASVDRVLFQAAGSSEWVTKPLSEIGSSSGGTVSGDYLPLSGGTINGIVSIQHTADKYARIEFVNMRAISGVDGSAVSCLTFKDGNSVARGYLGTRYIEDTLLYLYLGHYNYNGNNLRIYSDRLTFGENELAYLTSNVASATKLQTARTIWGQNFDGSGNISGDLFLTNNNYIYSYDNKGSYKDILGLSATNNLHVGNGTSEAGYTTSIHGNAVHLRYGTTHEYGLTLSSSGNIGIGTTSPAYKLHVVGESLLSQSENGNLYYRIKGVNYELAFGLGSGGVNRGIYDFTNTSWLIYRDSSTNVFIPQGNVGIGTTSPNYKLHVVGSGYFSSGINCATSSNSVNNSFGIRFATDAAYLSSNGSSVGIYARGSIFLRPGCTSGAGTSSGLGITIDTNGQTILAGDFTMANGKYIKFLTTDGNGTVGMYMTSNNNLIIGYGIAGINKSTYIDGENIIFRQGDSHAEICRFNANGLVWADGVTANIRSTSSAIQFWYKGLETNGVYLGNATFTPFTASTDLISLGNYNRRWKGIYLGIRTGAYNNENGVTFCDSSGNGVSRISQATNMGIISSGAIYLRPASTKGASGTISASSIGATIDTSGNMLVTGGITMYSDQRKKTILNYVELSLKQIADAPLIKHYYNSDQNKTTHVGSIAQYWARLNNWFCKKDSEGFYTMEIQNCALASAISIARHLEKYETKTDKKIRQLKKRISQLEDELEMLKNEGRYLC